MGSDQDQAGKAPRKPRQQRRRAAKPAPQPAAKTVTQDMMDQMAHDQAYDFPLTGGAHGVQEAAERIAEIRERHNRWFSGWPSRPKFPIDPTDKAKVRTRRRCVMRVAASDGQVLTFPHAAGLEGELLHVLRFDESVGVWWRCKMHVEAGPDILLCRAEAMEVTAPGNGRDVSVEIPGRAEDYSLLDGGEASGDAFDEDME